MARRKSITRRARKFARKNTLLISRIAVGAIFTALFVAGFLLNRGT